MTERFHRYEEGLRAIDEVLTRDGVNFTFASENEETEKTKLLNEIPASLHNRHLKKVVDSVWNTMGDLHALRELIDNHDPRRILETKTGRQITGNVSIEWRRNIPIFYVHSGEDYRAIVGEQYANSYAFAPSLEDHDIDRVIRGCSVIVNQSRDGVAESHVGTPTPEAVVSHELEHVEHTLRKLALQRHHPYNLQRSLSDLRVLITENSYEFQEKILALTGENAFLFTEVLAHFREGLSPDEIRIHIQNTYLGDKVRQIDAFLSQHNLAFPTNAVREECLESLHTLMRQKLTALTEFMQSALDAGHSREEVLEEARRSRFRHWSTLAERLNERKQMPNVANQ